MPYVEAVAMNKLVTKYYEEKNKAMEEASKGMKSKSSLRRPRYK